MRPLNLVRRMEEDARAAEARLSKPRDNEPDAV
jgi:hypothetical protein